MQFLNPNVLFLLLLLTGLIFLLSTNKDNLERFFDKNVLNKLQVDSKSMGKVARNVLLFLALILFVIALSRPVIDEKEQSVKQKLIPIVIALDVSKSMQASDIYPNRITLAKKKLKQIINSASNTTIGIVLFAKNSFIVSPITEDFTSLNYIVDNLDTSLDFTNGSNVMAVLEATEQMLKDYSAKNLIILSDGGNDDEYVDELEFAKENKIAIYTVGLATKTGAPIPNDNGYLTDKEGKIVTVALNKSIKKLALNSGGGYIGFSLADGDINAIINKIQSQSKKEELQSKKIKTYTELFYYPLGLGIFCLLVAFSSMPSFKRASAFALMAILFYPQENFAGLLDFKTLESAKQSYEKEDYKSAVKNYEKISSSNERNYNLANSYYKSGDFKKAIKSYGKIVTEDKELEYKKLHNLGNSYVNTKNLEKAKEFYEEALKLKDDKHTRENLEAVKKAMEKQNKDSSKKQDNKDNQDKNNKQEDKKNQEQKSKDNKEQKDKNKSSQESQKKDKSEEKKKQESKEKKDTNKQEDKSKQTNAIQQKQMEKQSISDMEEKKWLKALQKKKAPIMLQKVKSQREQKENEVEQPW